MAKPRITKKPEVRRQEILDAAEALFAELGYDETAVSQIVSRVGVTQGTFYHYFESKEALVEELTQRAVEGIADRIVARVSAPGTSFRARVAASLEEAFNPPASLTGVFEYSHRVQNSVLSRKMQLLMSQRLGPMLVALVDEGVAAGVFRVQHAAACADFIIGGVCFLLDKQVQEAGRIDWTLLQPVAAAFVEKLLGVADGWLGAGG